MTRTAALEALHRLAAGLPQDDAGVRRLLERASVLDDAEALRDALVELGAKALLEEAGSRSQEAHNVRAAGTR